MTLFHNPASPFVRKVRVLLLETGQQDRVALQTCMPTPVTPDTSNAANNPAALSRPIPSGIANTFQKLD
jgi:glutathione S-transferase